METKERGRISLSGMGGFLNPPTHPEHTHSVQSRTGDTFSMSLSSAVTSEWLDAGTRLAAKTLLDEWQKPAIESPEVQEWIRQVLGYFRGCYKNTEGTEDKLLIDSKIDPLTRVDSHAGVHLIREFYPAYQPDAVQFAEAY